MIANIYYYGQLTYNHLTDVINKITKEHTESIYLNMKQDLNGKDLAIGDRILICTEKYYGWLGYAIITGETPMSWKIELEEDNYNKDRLFNKDAKRIIKC